MKLTRRKFIETTVGAAAMAVPVVAASVPQSPNPDAITLSMLRKMVRKLEASGSQGPFVVFVHPSRLREISRLSGYLSVDVLDMCIDGTRTIHKSELPDVICGVIEDMFIAPSDSAIGCYIGSYDEWLPMIERFA